MKNREKKSGLRLFVMFILLAVFLYSAARLVHYAVHSISTRRTNEELQELFQTTDEVPEPEATVTEVTPTPTAAPEPRLLDCYQYIGDTVLPNAEKILAKNPDTVAWLHIPGGVVDLPVVYRDNTYYLNHDFNGKRSSSGTLFLDESHPFQADTQYLVIHGHNWYDGSMFGTVSHYRKKGYMEEHPTVYLTTLYRQEEYEVIGVLFASADIRSEEYVPYVGMRKFQSLDQFYDFAEIIQNNALHWKEGAEMNPRDSFLALSTCYEENRIVVICRRTDPQ